MQQTKKSFLLYHDQGKQVEMLSNEQAGVLLKSIFRFVSGEEAPRIADGMTQMCFSFIAAQIERDLATYHEKCKHLSENGRKGGKNTSKCKQLQTIDTNCNQLQTIAGDTDTDTVTVTDTVQASCAKKEKK